MSLYAGLDNTGLSESAQVFEQLSANSQISAEAFIYRQHPLPERQPDIASPKHEEKEKEEVPKQEQGQHPLNLVRPVFKPRKQAIRATPTKPIPQTRPFPPHLQKTRVEDWTSGTASTARRRRRNEPPPLSWDDEYDPARPTSLEDYMDSEEPERMISEWEAYVPGHEDGGSGEDKFDENLEINELKGRSLGALTDRQVRYELPSYEEGHLSLNVDRERETASSLDFAQRIMAKYGWEKGQGLGAASTGITKPLAVRPTKAGHGAIIDQNPERNLSKVVRLVGLDMEEADVQDIGDECSKKYGGIERIVLRKGNIYINFLSEASAARAVASLDGRILEGNAIRASFYRETSF